MLEDATQRSQLAAELATARRNRAPVEPLGTRFPWLTVEDAYDVQRSGTEDRVRQGSSIAGHKVGLTSVAMQQQLGVSEPDFGVLFAEDVLDDGAEIDLDLLIAPRIEPEIAFVLGRDLSGTEVSVDDVLAATQYVVPALEIIDSRITDWRITLVDTVADNASGAGVVLGRRRSDPASVSLPDVNVTMTVGDRPADTGSGVDVLGHPAVAVAWLASTLARFGTALRAGHIVLPGSMTKAAPIHRGEHALADFGSLGSVSCHVGPR